MKQSSYWLRMSVVALAALVVAVLSHYFWVSGEKDLMYSIGSSVPIIAAVIILLHFANMQRAGFDKMRLSYGWSLTVGALVLVVLDFLSYWLLCGTTPLKALVIGIVCPCSSGNNGLLQTGEKGGKEKFLIIRKDSPWQTSYS